MRRGWGQARQGFTLLELLMVVIIIGILTSIALPQYVRMSERARSSEAMIILSTIRSAQLRYKANSSSNVFTSNVSDLDVDVPGFGAANSSLWTYGTNTTHAIATRIGVGGQLYQNLLDGCTTSNSNTYGLPSNTSAC